MFRAIREWWLSEHSKSSLRLLGFELTVVMIGVFVAQQVSNWADRRAALNEVERLHRDIYHSFDAYRAIATVNQVAVPCFSGRVDAILEQASRPTVSTNADLLRPARIMKMAPDQISPEKWQLLRERYGDVIADTIGSIQLNLRTAERSGNNIEQRWFELQRLNPRYGIVSDADRSAVRETAVKLHGDLFALRKSSELILRQIAKLDVPHSSGVDIRPVKSCKEMWERGQSYVERK